MRDDLWYLEVQMDNEKPERLWGDHHSEWEARRAAGDYLCGLDKDGEEVDLPLLFIVAPNGERKPYN